MSQTKTGSFVESWANVAIGFSINWCANMLILPWFGFNITAGKAFGIGVVFTFISIARSYVIRRWFNSFKWDKAKTEAVTTVIEPQLDANVSTHAKEYNA